MPFWSTKTSVMPNKLGNYKILDLIGRGGMCEVYKAQVENMFKGIPTVEIKLSKCVEKIKV